MRRRLERAQRAGQVDPKARLYESDYLLGVHDMYRAGALRFRRDDEGPFLGDQNDIAAPPFIQLRALEAASLALEARREQYGERSGRVAADADRARRFRAWCPTQI
jgi:serine/threonine-protein kinase HipA